MYDPFIWMLFIILHWCCSLEYHKCFTENLSIRTNSTTNNNNYTTNNSNWDKMILFQNSVIKGCTVLPTLVNFFVESYRFFSLTHTPDGKTNDCATNTCSLLLFSMSNGLYPCICLLGRTTEKSIAPKKNNNDCILKEFVQEPV